jgi:pimeloyl-ACP methyl ester carboxylesterase
MLKTTEMLKLKFFCTICLLLLCAFVSFAQETTPSFNFVKKGDGRQNVILLAGLGTSTKVWDETIAVLSKTKTCYAISFSGFAGSKAQADPSLTIWENDIVKFIKDKKIKNPVLLGHSMGGTLALQIAANHPGIISKLVIVDAFPSPAALYDASFKRRENIDCTPIINQFAGMDESKFYDFQKTNISQMVSDKTRMETILDWFVKSDRKTFGKIYCELLNTDLREKLPAIKCPTLILLQPAFKSKEKEVSRQYASIKNADIRYAEKGLHFIMYDDREWFINSLQSFLK